MAFADIFYPALFYGAIVSLLITALVIILFRWNPEIFVHDLPPKLQERYGPVRDKTRRDSRMANIAVFLLLAGLLVFMIVDLYRRAGGAPGFWAIFLTLFIAMQTFNVIDLLFFDWLLVATLKPKAMMIPGTETWEGHADYAFHFRGFLKGFVGITAASLVFGGMAVLIGNLLL
jgi:hypothetical protein